MSFKYYGALSHVATYNKFRPSTPASLINAISNYLRQGEEEPWQQAVDVGCGSGQSTAALSPFFNKVSGFDPSPDIIKQANSQNQLQNVIYSVSSAEKLPLEDDSVELVTTGQSIHWFNTDLFYAEVNRILKKNGVLAVYGYKLPEPMGVDGSSAPSAIVRKYYEEVLRDHVLPGSRQVYLNNYRDDKFNQVPIVQSGIMTRQEGFVTEMEVTISDITGYISSWSGFQNYVKQNGERAGEAVLQQFEGELSSVLGKKPDDIINVSYRYFALLGRKL